MTYYSKIIQLNEFKYENYAMQAWMNTKKQTRTEYWAHRIISELTYLKEVSRFKAYKYDALIEEVSKKLYEALKNDGAITKNDVLQAEKSLEISRDDAKAYEICFASHAHIDINWLWGFHETVQITIDTFQTMLDIMKENENFIFSQSQGALYQIIEEYHPIMFEEIKQRVKEGRWEVTAATWVEGDKNLSNGESQARQILYTKQYFKKHFGLNHDDLIIDFEPDTFGHVETIPEILNHGKVKYYYHVRGNKEFNVYRYQAPSGKEIIAYRDAKVYTMGVDGHYARNIVEFCEAYYLKKALAVYGVSDHGGGPTRKDIEMIEDMKTWPIYPKISFTTYHRYFQYLEKHKDQLPIVDKELNVIFSGCYTSQTRIKMANRFGENRLYDTECVNALATSVKSIPYQTEKYEEAWRKILVNQFHDILPGSGVTYTREYALGKFQEVMARVLTNSKLSLESLSKEIDTSCFQNHIEDYYDTAYGAGVGFNSEAFQLSKVSRGRGSTRIYHLWNTLPFERREYVEIFVWNYEDDIRKIKFVDSKGQALPFERSYNPKVIFEGSMKEQNEDNYWGHWYQTFLVEVTIPSLGYETIVLMQDNSLENVFNNYLMVEDNIPHLEEPHHYVLENELIRITFNPETLNIKSFYDKENKEEFMTEKEAGFYYVEEDGTIKMDAWKVGRTKTIDKITDISHVQYIDGQLTKQITFHAKMHDSEMDVRIKLPRNEKQLIYEIKTEWKEFGEYQYEVKKLAYHFPINKEINHYEYDVAFGITKRDEIDMDVAGLSFAYANYDRGGVLLVTDSKYGFRGYQNELQVALIRSTTDPDPYPEIGSHQFKFKVGIIQPKARGELIKESKRFNHPIEVVMGEVKKGTAPLSYQYGSLKGDNVVLSSMKLSEDQKGYLILRFYECDGIDTKFTFDLPKDIIEACYTDLLENEGDKVPFIKNQLHITVLAHSIVTVKVKLK